VASPELLAMALALLPPLPRELTCLRNDGGQLRVSLIEERDGHLYAELSLLDAREGLTLTIPLETADRGGYSIGCDVIEIYFMGGLDSAAKLAVTEIARRKPYRAKERVATDAVAHLHIIAAKDFALGHAVFARVVDVSSRGIGLATDQEFAVGDRLRLDTSIKGIAISAEISVVATTRIAFGRFRTGCRFRHIPLDTQRGLDALATTHA
jgi:hypothetical protein